MPSNTKPTYLSIDHLLQMVPELTTEDTVRNRSQSPETAGLEEHDKAVRTDAEGQLKLALSERVTAAASHASPMPWLVTIQCRHWQNMEQYNSLQLIHRTDA